MAWIRQITESEATGPIGNVYAAAHERAGGVANIIRVMSQDGPTAQASMQFYTQLMKRPKEAGCREKRHAAYRSRPVIVLMRVRGADRILPKRESPAP